MKKTIAPFLLLTTSLLYFQACNPDCESVSANNISIVNDVVLQEGEILLKSIPVNLLKKRDVYVFMDGTPDPVKEIKLESRFVKTDQLQGRIAKLPEWALDATPILC